METPPKTTLKPACCTPLASRPSPYESKEEKPYNCLSASLKERLKRSRRSFTSPVSVAKRLCVDEEEDGQHVQADTQETVGNPPRDSGNVDMNNRGARPVTKGVPGPAPEPTQPPPEMLQLRDQLRCEVREKTETLRRLKMVKMYRSKNDFTQLQHLIDKWRCCTQAALYELQTDLPIDGQKASISQLIDLFGLDDSMLHFDRTEDDFTT